MADQQNRNQSNGTTSRDQQGQPRPGAAPDQESQQRSQGGRDTGNRSMANDRGAATDRRDTRDSNRDETNDLGVESDLDTDTDVDLDIDDEDMSER
jgi:hypothetical protein